MVAQIKTISEHDIQKLILEWLQLNGFYAWRQNVGAAPYTYKGKTRFIRYGQKGAADILGISIDKTGGRLLAVECKVPGKSPTPDQQAFLDAINDQGGIAFCAHSLDEVIAYFK